MGVWVAAQAVFDAGGPMTLGQMAPRMSPGLRPPPLFGKTPSPRCAIRPIIIFKQPCWQARDGYLSTKQRRPTTPVDAGRRDAQRGEVKEEAAGRGTRTALSATPSCVPQRMTPNEAKTSDRH